MKYLHQLKSQAKKLSKKECLILTKAQDKIAVENGYQDWQKLTQDFTFCIGLWKPDSEFKVLKVSSKTIAEHYDEGSNPCLLRGLQDLIAGEKNRITFGTDASPMPALPIHGHGLLENVPTYYMQQVFPGVKEANISVLMDEEGTLKNLPKHRIKIFVGSLAFIGLKPIYFEGEFDGYQWIGLDETQIKLCKNLGVPSDEWLLARFIQMDSEAWVGIAKEIKRKLEDKGL